MQTPAATRSGKSRIEWMDALRGLAIVLVVYDHALRFTIEYAGQAPAVLTFISETLNPLRMPAMVFLSGMLLSASLSKGPATYIKGKVRNILYPYLLWSAIYVTLFIAAQPITGSDHGWWEYTEIFYSPPAHLWFLYYLFFYYLLMLGLQRVPRLVIAGGSLTLAVLMADVPLLPRFWFLFAFFALGDLA
ncbi:MAG TPA: acyltransferase, partial [Arenibaculum sp.]|nr:acyltransferase [Arenibaculum sp.]